MELIVPLVLSSFALLLLLIGIFSRYVYNQGEIFLFTMILSTIFFFVSGITFLDVTYVNPATGDLVTTQAYNILIWIMVPFGFVPILLMYEWGFENAEGD